MSKHRPWIALPFALAAAGFGFCTLSTAQAGTPVSCEIRVAEAAGARELSAVVKATAPVAGSYQFDLNAVSAGGNAKTSQSDDVSLAAGETVVSTTSVNAGSTYTAKLTVTWPGGSTSCVNRS